LKWGFLARTGFLALTLPSPKAGEGKKLKGEGKKKRTTR
jgi:hypothetical protein